MSTEAFRRCKTTTYKLLCFSIAASERIGKFQDPRAHALVVDYQHSKGNYIVDADGNELLDVFAQIGTLCSCFYDLSTPSQS